MEASRTSATAMLVGTPDVERRAQAATISVPREEIEEALASDASPELILEVQLGNAQPRDLHVAWERGDLETVLAATGPGGITFAFEPTEIYRALEHPDFEGHGLREAVLLTVAAASASAALAATTAHAGIAEGTGIGGGATAAVVAPGHDEASTASTVASGTAVTPGHDEAGTAGALAAATAVNDEAGATARGIGVTIPGADEADPGRTRDRAAGRRGRPRRGRHGGHAREPGGSERRGGRDGARDRDHDAGSRRGDPRGARDRARSRHARRGDARRARGAGPAGGGRLGHVDRPPVGRPRHGSGDRRARRCRPADRRRHVRRPAPGRNGVETLRGRGPPGRRSSAAAVARELDQASPRKRRSSMSRSAGRGSASGMSTTSVGAGADRSGAEASSEPVRR